MYVVKIGVLSILDYKNFIEATKTRCFYQISFVVFYQPICFVGRKYTDG